MNNFHSIKFNSDDDDQSNLPNHIYTNQEIEDLFSTDSCSKIRQDLRKEKDNLLQKIKDDVIGFIKSNSQPSKEQDDDENITPIKQDMQSQDSNQEKEQVIEEEEEFYEENADQSNILPSYYEEENQENNQEHSDKVPSEIFNSFVDEEEERSKFNFEKNSQDLPADELSQIEKVDHYESAGSNSQIRDEEELHSINFMSENDEEKLNLSPIGDNQQIEKQSGELSSASHISDNNQFKEFESDAFMEEFGD